MRISYDSEVDALYIELRACAPGQVESRDLGPGLVGDFDPDGRLSGLEVLDATEVLGKSPDRILIEVAPQKRPSAA